MAEDISHLTDLVKSARGQLGTFSHGKGAYLPFLSRAAERAEGARAFLSRPARAAAVAAGLLATLSLVNFLRGWGKAVRMKGRGKRGKARARSRKRAPGSAKAM